MLREVSINKIKPNPLQPRRRFNKGKLKELAKSIKEVGILNPIHVRPRKGWYEIISGERRWRAAKLVGLQKIPVIIREVDEKKLLIDSLIENIHREDLSYVERAKTFRRMMKLLNLKNVKALSKIVGLSATEIRNILDAASLREELPLGIRERASLFVISETKTLPKEERKKVIEIAVKKDLGGRKVRKLVSILKRAPIFLRAEILRRELEPELAEKRLKEWKREPLPSAEVIANQIECPICKTRLYLLHKYPRGHRVEEV